MKKKNLFILSLFLMILCQSVSAQNLTVRGTVIDETGQPLPGVNIVVKNTTIGQVSGLDGKYSVGASHGDILVFSFVGYDKQEAEVNSETINITLIQSTSKLDDVVVIAYGEQSRKKLVQSISSVSREDIEHLQAIAPQELLQGQASGVNVVNSSGLLGAAPVIKIRGVASISSGGQPLIVIDGVPVNDATTTSGQGGMSLNPIADLNPNDIESFSVLKDAGATAIYGSRGANGVILITTKHGKRNQPTRVKLDLSTSWSQLTDIFDMMSADEWRNFKAEVLPPFMGGGDPNNFPQGEYDWLSSVVRTGFSKDLNIGIDGGTDKTTFFLGLSYSNQQGFVVGNNLQRLGTRINLTHDVNNRLRIGMNMGITHTTNDRVASGLTSASPVAMGQLQIPYVQPKDDEGNYVNTGFISNVIAIEALNTNDAISFRSVGNIFSELKIFEGLKFRSEFGIDRLNMEAVQRSVDVNTPGGFAFNSLNQQNRFVATNTLCYSKTFNDVHDIRSTTGITYEETEILSLSSNGSGFLSDLQLNTVSASTKVGSNTVTGSRLVGYFTRLNYSYDDKYIFEGSIRRDGSSRFGLNNKYGTFWALGGGWIVSSEDFMLDINWLSSLKLRANIGESGNDRIGNFASLESFVEGTGSNYNNLAGLTHSSAPNPDLRWERSRSYNIGFELGVLRNRFRLNAEYYKKETTDLILNVPIPVTNGGIGSITSNAGSMENHGFDFDLGADIIRSRSLMWTLSLNLGINRNKVLELPGTSVDPEGRRYIQGAAEQRAIEGYSVNTFYLIRYKGVNPDTGHAEWLDADGNPTTNPVADDAVIVGDANPDFAGGLRSSLRYRNFDLSFLVNFSYGNDIYVNGYTFTDKPDGMWNNRTTLLDIWRNPGDNAYTPSSASPTFRTFTRDSDAFLRDGSYARLKNVTLSYNLPKTILGGNRIFKDVKIYLTGNNILTLKSADLQGVDPEVTSSMSNIVQGITTFTPPQSKSIIVGVSIVF